MFDNPQQEVKKMSKKLRPIKMSDEEFELFYKEIYAEFGPKNTAPVVINPQVEEPVAEEIPQEAPAAPVYPPVDAFDQENAAKAAAKIRNVHADEVINDYTDGVKVSKKEKGIAGLVVTLCIECLGIAAVVAYWLVHIL